MRFKLFEYLARSIAHPLDDTAEMQFFRLYRDLLDKREVTRRYAAFESGFDLIQSCVVIRALLNREALDRQGSRAGKNRRDQAPEKDSLPFFTVDDTKIFIPFFPQRINARYDRDLHSLFREPLSPITTEKGLASFFVNPFLEYGLPLFESCFTNLIPVARGDNMEAFLSLSFDEIYAISDEGTLECTIPLFDKGIASPSRIHILERAKRLMAHYFAFDREGFIRALAEEGFISAPLLAEILKRTEERESKIQRHARNNRQ